MKIDLKKLISAKAESIPFAGTVDLSAEEFNGERPFRSPVRYNGEIISQTDVLRLRGAVETTYETRCARCLKPLAIPLSIQVDMVLMPDDGEAVEEDDIFLFQGDAIDPADVLIPELLLQIDMVYLCKEDCKGLCPHCGADRNVTRCDCGETHIDDRLAVLKTLLDKRQEDD